jgi:mRNA deadenylase 3'-5' endonuclease subunit Ccr4
MKNVTFELKNYSNSWKNLFHYYWYYLSRNGQGDEWNKDIDI